MLIRIKCYNCENWNLYDFTDNRVGDIFECAKCKSDVADLVENSKGECRNEIYYLLKAEEEGTPQVMTKLVNGELEDDFCTHLIPEDLTIGTPGYVSFDWEKALKLFEKGLLCGFYHEHPGSDNPARSNVDVRTMKSWVITTDIPLLCAIGNGKGIINSWLTWGEDTKNSEGKLVTVVKSRKLPHFDEYGGIFYPHFSGEDFKRDGKKE